MTVFVGQAAALAPPFASALAGIPPAKTSNDSSENRNMSSKLHDIFRLVMTSTLSDRVIARSVGVSKNTVRRYRHLAVQGQCSWVELAALDEHDLDARFNQASGRLTQKRMPDFTLLHQEMQRTGVTLQLLWEEYRAPAPDDALSYSQFTHLYRQHANSLKLSMRQMHHPGEKAFVDFSGKKPQWVDSSSGEVHRPELFVASLGYSNLIFACAVPSQTVEDWIDCHVRMFEAFGGVPAVLVPDNLKSAVLKAGSEPVLNRAYLELARHYETAILPARAYRPKDKAKAEVSVQIAQRWILARLRNQTFFSLPELNRVIAALVAELNERPFKRLPSCRRSRFETYERPALHPLPEARFEPSRWSAMQTIPPDYHLPVEGHWYSVPFHLVGRKAEARIGGKVVEVFCDGKRVASHARSDAAGGHTTAPEHQPPQHRAYAERTPEHFLAWAGEIGPGTLAVVRHQFDRKVPLLGLPACDALKRIARQHGSEVLELAAARALEIKSPTVKSIRSLISTKRYRRMQGDPPEQTDLPLHHHNVRGPGYFTRPGGGAC